MSNHHHSKVLIVGSGPAGYTAAIYAARANLEPILVKGLEPGGQLTITTDVENYPGFAEAVQGPWLMEQMLAQAAAVGTRTIDDIIVKADLGRRPFALDGDSGDTYSGDTLIISTGASARWLGLESERRLTGFGVSACATWRRLFLPRQGSGGHWRRQHGGRGVLVPHKIRHQGDPGPPARPTARRKDLARPSVR